MGRSPLWVNEGVRLTLHVVNNLFANLSPYHQTLIVVLGEMNAAPEA